MFYLFKNEALNYPVIVQADSPREAEILFDHQYGFVLGWYADSNENAVALVRENGLERLFKRELVETVNIEYGTDGEEFAEIFS